MSMDGAGGGESLGGQPDYFEGYRYDSDPEGQNLDPADEVTVYPSSADYNTPDTVVPGGDPLSGYHELLGLDAIAPDPGRPGDIETPQASGISSADLVEPIPPVEYVGILGRAVPPDVSVFLDRGDIIDTTDTPGDPVVYEIRADTEFWARQDNGLGDTPQ